MNISKKVPIIVTIVLVVIWVFLGYRSAECIEGLSADPAFFPEVTLAEDVSVINRNKVVDAVLSDEKQYDHTDIPAGTVGTAFIPYGRRHHTINDPETDINGFSVRFYINEENVSAHLKTGPESQLEEGDIYYKQIENYEEIISEYNQKTREAKSEWRGQLILRLLTGLIVAAVFSVIFFVECIVANKIKMHPVVFGILCFIYGLMLTFAILAGLLF